MARASKCACGVASVPANPVELTSPWRATVISISRRPGTATRCKQVPHLARISANRRGDTVLRRLLTSGAAYVEGQVRHCDVCGHVVWRHAPVHQCVAPISAAEARATIVHLTVIRRVHRPRQGHGRRGANSAIRRLRPTTLPWFYAALTTAHLHGNSPPVRGTVLGREGVQWSTQPSVSVRRASVLLRRACTSSALMVVVSVPLGINPTRMILQRCDAGTVRPQLLAV